MKCSLNNFENGIEHKNVENLFFFYLIHNNCNSERGYEKKINIYKMQQMNIQHNYKLN